MSFTQRMKSLQQGYLHLKSFCWPAGAATAPVTAAATTTTTSSNNNSKSKKSRHHRHHRHHRRSYSKKHSMNVLFLDIDGVLLPFETDVGPPFVFPEKNLQALSSILEAMPNTVVVLSSTWRVAPCFYNQVLQSFAQFSAAHGGPLGSITTFFDMTDPHYHENRQWEIHRWLQQYQRRNSTTTTSTQQRIKAWVAIDDVDLLEGEKNSLYKLHFQGRVVKTDSRVGLTMEDAALAIQILRQQHDERCRHPFQQQPRSYSNLTLD